MKKIFGIAIAALMATASVASATDLQPSQQSMVQEVQYRGGHGHGGFHGGYHGGGYHGGRNWVGPAVGLGLGAAALGAYGGYRYYNRDCDVVYNRFGERVTRCY
jgi:opacity protein-like surface antigen